jgi:endoglucanase
MKNLQSTLFVLVSLMVTACGGGGGGGSDTPAVSSSSRVSSAASSSSSISQSSVASSSAGVVSGLIKINQLGFKPLSEKIAVVPAVTATSFTVINKSDSSVVLTGNLSAAATWTPAQESVKLADFSSLQQIGSYELQVEGVEKAAEFSISNEAYDEVNAAAVKAFYFNRASTELLEEHAGIYKRAAGHPGDNVKIHESAATQARPAGTIVSAPKGWYDAGDYNLYVVNSGISTYTLLAAYENFSDYFQTQNLNIPESGDAVPDILNEAMWNLEWMMKMQDPNDNGVYHKLTSKTFNEFEMPGADLSERFMVGKTTAAALNFAATMAAASRIYADYEAAFPGQSAAMLAAAKTAYQWAKANPSVIYVQPNDISTGDYGDGNLADEFIWAAAELYIVTQEETYYNDIGMNSLTADVPWWGGVKTLGLISLAHNLDSLSEVADKDAIKTKLNNLATNIVNKRSASAYALPLVADDFNWGSNSGAMNNAWILLEAYQLDKTKTQYLNVAQSLLDYVLGRNATDYSFVTGFGKKTPQDIHHRPSGSDGIQGAIPGFLVGGPNARQEDKNNCGANVYPSNLPAKSYLDNQCSYASNEIAINWNAPFVYVSSAIQVLTE